MLIAGFQSLVVDDRRRRALDGDQPRSRACAGGADAAANGGSRTAGGAIESMSRVDRRRRGMIWVGTNNGLHQGHARRRQDVGDVSIAGLPNAGARRDARRRCVALRRGRGVRRGRLSPRRRLHAVRLPHARLRQDVDEDRQRPADRTSRAAASRASSANDTKKAGLLFAGTESGMYVSFDDGDHWQSLQLEPADHVVPRHRDQGQRSRRRHVRPRLLGARRLLDAAPARAERRERGRRISSSRATRCACAATSAPTRRSRPRCRTRSIRPTA